MGTQRAQSGEDFRDVVWSALRTVIDPELQLDVVTLGLIYDVDVAFAAAGATVRVTHTLTTPGCPMEQVITAGIRGAVGGLAGVSSVETRLVWDPQWHPGMMAPGAA